MFAASFQSTLPIREETVSVLPPFRFSFYFNPLFPYGKRPGGAGAVDDEVVISIHSSHTGRDSVVTSYMPDMTISIHSSHTGRDLL